MSATIPNLTPRQSLVVIGCMAMATREVAKAYRTVLGEGGASEYEALVSRLIRDTRNAMFEGLSMEDEPRIVEAVENLTAAALAT